MNSNDVGGLYCCIASYIRDSDVCVSVVVHQARTCHLYCRRRHNLSLGCLSTPRLLGLLHTGCRQSSADHVTVTSYT